MFKSANIGAVDRAIRMIAGLVLIVLPFLLSAGTAWMAWGLPVVGAILIITGFSRFCPAYHLLGIKTCKS